MADETLSGFRAGAQIVSEGFEQYDKNKSYRDRLAQQSQAIAAQKEQLAYERSKDAGLSPSELDDFKKNNILPSRMGAKAQVLGMEGQEKIASSVAKVQNDFNTKNPKVNDIDRKNYEIAYGRKMPDGMDTWSAAQQKEVSELAKQKQKPAGPTGNGSLKDQQFWEKAWVDTGKDMDLQKASSRTPLGMAVTNNMKQSRGVALLDSKNTYTPQDESLITSDLTAIMKGGSPDEELLRSQQYGSYYKDGVNLLQRITGNPQMLNDPKVKAHLRDVMQGIKKIDNDAIENHIASVELTRADVIKRRPQDWQKLKDRQLDFIRNGGQGASATRYSDPTKATDIKKRYKSGAITAEEASKELDALGK